MTRSNCQRERLDERLKGTLSDVAPILWQHGALARLKPGETIKIPTGIRVFIESDWVLNIFPRSGLGFKFRLQMNNTVGIIDSDYFYSDNEGHIFAKLTNDSNEGKTVSVPQGTGMVQGIFMQYGVTIDDDATEVRNGGFGSTTK